MTEEIYNGDKVFKIESPELPPLPPEHWIGVARQWDAADMKEAMIDCYKGLYHESRAVQQKLASISTGGETND